MPNHINLLKGEIMVDVLSFKDSGFYIAFIPALNLVAHSKNKKEDALNKIEGAVHLFFDYWQEKGKLNDKLESLGWKRTKKRLLPSNEDFQIPYALMGKKFSKSEINIPSFA